MHKNDSVAPATKTLAQHKELRNCYLHLQSLLLCKNTTKTCSLLHFYHDLLTQPSHPISISLLLCPLYGSFCFSIITILLYKQNASIKELLDFSSAFDIINHSILPHRLHSHITLNDSVLQWSSAYPKQYVTHKILFTCPTVD